MEFNWSPGADNGNPITSYFLTIPPDSRTFTIPPDWRYYTVNNLSAAVTYYPTLAASNSDGLGPSSNFREFQCGSVPPTAPATVSASFSATTNSAIVSWTPPPTLPDATIFWYYVQSQSSKPADPIITASADGLQQTSLQLTGLVANSQYSFLVRPVNCPGYGPCNVSPSVGFNPSAVNGLRFWIDGSDSGTITLNGSRVSQWNDKSGNSYNTTQTNATYQPARNGNYVVFSNNYNVDIPQAAINNTSNWGMFMVLNPVSQSNWIFVKQWNGVNSFNVFSMSYTSDNTGGNSNSWNQNIHWHSYNQVSSFHSGFPAVSSTTQLIEVFGSPSNLVFYKDGKIMSSNTVTSNQAVVSSITGATNFKLGAWEAGSFVNSAVTNFQLGELVFYNSTVTSSDRVSLENYFFEKWGITTQASNFSPSSITGLGAWYDGADPLGTGTPPANGATVATWVDKSGNARNGLTGGGNAARYVAGSPGYMFFGGSNGYELTNSSSYLTSNYFTIIAAVRQSRVFNTPVVVGNYNNGGPGTYMNFYLQSSQITWDVNTSNLNSSYTPSFNGNFSQEPIRVWSLSFTNNLRRIFLNGRVLASAVINNQLSSWGFPSIGKGTNQFYFYEGNMMEILIYTGEMSDANRSNVESYLYRKWGVDHLAAPLV